MACYQEEENSSDDSSSTESLSDESCNSDAIDPDLKDFLDEQTQRAAKTFKNKTLKQQERLSEFKVFFSIHVSSLDFLIDKLFIFHRLVLRVRRLNIHFFLGKRELLQ